MNLYIKIFGNWENATMQQWWFKQSDHTNITALSTLIVSQFILFELDIPTLDAQNLHLWI